MFKKAIGVVGAGVLSAFTLLAGYFMLEVGSAGSFSHCLNMETKFIILNMFTIGVVLALLIMLTNRVWLGNAICNTAVGVVAIINYYTVVYRGMPFTPQDILNAKTALNVVSSYDFSIDKKVVFIAVIAIGMIALSLFYRWTVRKIQLGWKQSLVRTLGLVVSIVLVFYVGYFGPDPVKPKDTITWLWSEAYYKYGYAACTVESIQKSVNYVNRPLNYSESAIENIHIEQKKTSANCPDIILILNETFYDLAQISDIKTDAPYLQHISNMDNLLRGYAITPSAGGGTNNSEYELLSSNSLYLMPGITPFNVIELDEANSIVSHLEALGYKTLGTHSEPPVNYMREKAYTAIGFDKAYFVEDYQALERYGSRYFKTDESLYKNLIRWYEEEIGQEPQLMYMLTIQNHGEWEGNDPEYDTVHALNDYGLYDAQVDEFLTLIQMSDQAFADLTEYFTNVDRPVVVCMVGDHSPHFARPIAKHFETSEELELRLRKVPLLIWANYELPEQDLGTISMTQVIPTLLDAAGVRMSPWYQYQLDLKKDVPIITSYGKYYDAQGNMYDMDDSESPYKEKVEQYFHMEYNNLQTKRNQQLFDPYLSE